MKFSFQTVAYLLLPLLFLIPFIYLQAWFGEESGFKFFLLALFTTLFSLIQIIFHHYTPNLRVHIALISLKYLVCGFGAIRSIIIPLTTDASYLLIGMLSIILYFVLLAIPTLFIFEIRDAYKKYHKHTISQESQTEVPDLGTL